MFRNVINRIKKWICSPHGIDLYEEYINYHKLFVALEERFQVQEEKLRVQTEQIQTQQKLIYKQQAKLNEIEDTIAEIKGNITSNINCSISAIKEVLAKDAYIIDQLEQKKNELEYRIKHLTVKQQDMRCIDKNKRVVQLVSVLKSGDAVGNIIVAIDNLLKENGYQSNIYAYENCTDLSEVCILDEESYFSPNDIVVVHVVGEMPFLKEISMYSSKKILFYHNITPPAFYERYDTKTADYLKFGLDEVKNLSQSFDFCITVSEYNKMQLVEMGYTCQIEAIPCLVDYSIFDIDVEKKKKDRKTIIYVGRVVPNKEIEDIINAYNRFIEIYGEIADLYILGSYNENDVYYQELKSMNNKGKVCFTGKVSQEELVRFYKNADLYISMSEHEGFCIPLVEAMYNSVPIIAYDSSAIAETLGMGGILVEEKDFDLIAEKINQLLFNEEVKNTIKSNQKAELKRFTYDIVSDGLLRVFRSFIEEI